MMQLNNDYQRDDFIKFLEEDFLTDFKRDVRPVNTSSLTCINKAQYLGESKGLDLQVFEFVFEGSANKRVALTKDAFSVMRSSAIYNALAVFHSGDNKDWRFSLLTATPEPTEKGKVSLTYSNPKRLSFFLGQNAKINTPTKFLISKGKVTDFDDLKSRFSIEVVNKEFYKEISQVFTKLVSGQLKLPSTQDKSKTNLEFAVRLIGRIIFCWFLREKKSEAGLSLMPKDLLSIGAVQENKDYYHKILEPIFFEVLNKQVKSRREDFAKEPFSSVPYLNGGLFSPQEDDYYKRMNGDLQSQFHNTLVIPDSWINDFFEILETYNFTIDENTSYDEELSIDPEMLGRIFENLLAEINPETGESARKSTGSYYTPRTIVNYMVDESLLLYLKEQTEIKEEKLKAIISYDLSDDSENPVSTEEKEKIIEALEKVKILDPACGSGAFPIGALQKIVFILQQIDPDGIIWKKQQLAKADLEFRRDIENRFSKNEIDFLRKLSIIRKSIFGIDIQPIATEISRLRCFLTLIVDESIDDHEENRGIKPLPNLDFKFVTANSLVGLPKIDKSQQTMFDDYQKIDELKEIRNNYFGADMIEREQLKTEFSNKKLEIFKSLEKEHGWAGFEKAELTRKLTDWEPFTHKPTSWFDPEWMFGIKDGLDIVIANPPYIKEYVNKTVFIELKRSPYYQGKMDFWYFFTCKGIDLLKPQGTLCFIAQNNWPTNYGASKMRNKITQECQIISLVDFTDYKVFDAGVQTMVFLLKKNSPKKSYEARYAKVIDKNISIEAIGELLLNMNKEIGGTTRFKATIDPQNLINKNISFTDKSDYELLHKIESKRNFSLTENEVAQGIVAAPDKYFIVHSLTSFNDRELEFIKPFYTSTSKYVSSKNRSYIIYLCNKNFGNKKIEDYPNIKSHFEQFKTILKEAKRKYGTPEKPYFYLHREREERFFQAGPKIVGQARTFLPSFLYTEDSYYGSRAMNFIKTNRINLKYLVGLLNSCLMFFWLKNKGKQLGDLLQIDKGPLLGIPIFKPDEEIQQTVAVLVEKVTELYGEYRNNLLGSKNMSKSTTAEIKHTEAKIDQIFYKLYDLTEEEVAIVEK